MRIVPIHPQGPTWPNTDRAAWSEVAAMPATGQRLLDRWGRAFTDLRVSVTDRCNFRCGYCMPRAVFGPGHEFLPHAELLSFEEITRLAQVFTTLGMRKLRITGGEPLMRKGLPQLIGMLRASPGASALEVALTTNGALLARHAAALKAAGLDRVTVSLDALDADRFRAMSDSQVPVDAVLEGIHEAQAQGLGPIKVNMVVRRGHNDDQILPMAEYFSGTGAELRFIEYMDVGSTNGWRTDQVLPAQDIVALLHRRFDLVPQARKAGDTAIRFTDRASGARFGVIASVTEPFCGDCSRLRLSSDGKLYTCLFASAGHDLKVMLRQGEGNGALAGFIANTWRHRADRYSETRHLAAPSAPRAQPARAEMSYLGG